MHNITTIWYARNGYETNMRYFLNFFLMMQLKWENFKMRDFMVCKIKYGKGELGEMNANN